MTRYCSLPQFGNVRKWFEKNFHSACEYHDSLYTTPVKVTRLKADLMLFNYMLVAINEKPLLSKTLTYYPIIIITFLAVRIFGWTHYNTKAD